jgi:hypothetical protein
MAHLSIILRESMPMPVNMVCHCIYIRFHDFRKKSSAVEVIVAESFDHQYLWDASLNCTINRLSEAIEATHVGCDRLPA